MKYSSLLFFTLFALSASAEDIAIEHVTLYPISGGVIQDGTILIRDGVIADVGTGVSVPEGGRRIDGRGKHVMPGIVDTQIR
jgi:imidazolonepropionase-like amidohydrolase